MISLIRLTFAILVLLFPVMAKSAAMKVGDLVAINSIIATNTITGSNIIDRYDVRWWGADPTGVGDSTTAIQNALNWAVGAKVRLGQGTYLISGLRISSQFQTLSGDGPGTSLLISSTTAPMLVMAGSGNVIENLSLRATGNVPYGIYITNSGGQKSIFRNIAIDRINGTGIYSQTNSWSMVFDRCMVNNCHIGIHLGDYFQNSRIDHCLLHSNTNYNMILGTKGILHYSISIRDTQLESIGTATNLLINDVAGVVMDGIYCESSAIAGKDIVLDGITSLVGINGMYANGIATSTNSIFVIGSSNALHLRDSYIWNYSAAPVVGTPRLLIVNTVTNGVYQ